MPELPEVEALARFLEERTAGHADRRRDPGQPERAQDRHPVAHRSSPGSGSPGSGAGASSWTSTTVEGLHLVWHLSRAGWVQWRDEVPSTPVKPGKGPLALRLAFVTDDGEPAGGIDVTEAGTQKRLALYVVHDPRRCPGSPGWAPMRSRTT